MIVLGSNSEVAQAFVEKVLSEGKRYPLIYLFTSNRESAEKFAHHIEVKYIQKCEVVEVDLMQNIDYHSLHHIDSDLLFCASGYLGKNTEEGLYDNQNTQRIIDVNYAKLVPLINFFAKKWKRKETELSLPFLLWQGIEVGRVILSMALPKRLSRRILADLETIFSIKKYM